MTRDKVVSAVAGLTVLIGPRKDLRRASPDVILERDAHVAHLGWMLGEIVPFYDAGRIEKAMRWLGYVQGACTALGLCTIGQTKDLNKPDDALMDGAVLDEQSPRAVFRHRSTGEYFTAETFSVAGIIRLQRLRVDGKELLGGDAEIDVDSVFNPVNEEARQMLVMARKMLKDDREVGVMGQNELYEIG